MVIRFDKEVDIIYIKLTDGEITESDEQKPGAIIDYDAMGNIVGIEVLDASKKMKQPNGISYEVA
jgi:uncharacterized protein YuzE